jgi:hypothetical protein
MSRDGGGAMRGDATTSQGKRGNTATRQQVERQQRVKRLRRKEKPCNNQMGKWKATARQEVMTHQERERRRNYRQRNSQPGQTREVGASRGNGMTRGNAAWTNKG